MSDGACYIYSCTHHALMYCIEHTILFPWETWGPKMTRCLHTGRMSVNSYGWRIALEDRILDFNQLDIARDRLLAENGYPDFLNGVIQEPTVIPGGQLFCSDVVTSLPYRESAFRQSIGPTVGPIYFDDQELLVLRVSICTFIIGF